MAATDARWWTVLWCAGARCRHRSCTAQHRCRRSWDGWQAAARPDTFEWSQVVYKSQAYTSHSQVTYTAPHVDCDCYRNMQLSRATGAAEAYRCAGAPDPSASTWSLPSWPPYHPQAQGVTPQPSQGCLQLQFCL